jgi:hypothetical protein
MAKDFPAIMPLPGKALKFPVLSYIDLYKTGVSLALLIITVVKTDSPGLHGLN